MQIEQQVFTVHSISPGRHHTQLPIDYNYNASMQDSLPCRRAHDDDYRTLVGLYRISAPAPPANPESGRFSEIRPSPAPAKFQAGFGGYR